MTLEQLEQLLLKENIRMTDTMKKQLDMYMQLLIQWNEKMNLTSITKPEEIIEKHFYDSLLPFFTFSIEGKVIDVGSGAGFPGLVWKILFPQLNMVLLEPIGKRCVFLNEVIHELSLDKIQVVNERAEEHVKEHREEYDVVTARAVANLRVLSELCAPLVKKNGQFIAMKGNHGKEELSEASNALKILGLQMQNLQEKTLPNGDVRNNICIIKTKETPIKYPRNYGQIKKKPL